MFVNYIRTVHFSFRNLSYTRDLVEYKTKIKCLMFNFFQLSKKAVNIFKGIFFNEIRLRKKTSTNIKGLFF